MRQRKFLHVAVAILWLGGVAGHGEEAITLSQELLRKARADMVLLFVIVWGMVAKPQWTGGWQILAMAAVVALGGIAFLRRQGFRGRAGCPRFGPCHSPDSSTCASIPNIRCWKARCRSRSW
jgi:hypothetical protein